MLRNKSYFLWLLEKIEWYEVDVYEYKKLLWLMYQKEFVWSVDHDENRASKGLNLRYEYDPKMDCKDEPCSVLEMMIALAHDWEHEICYDFTKGDRSAKWFWVMIENLGLNQFNDRNWSGESARMSNNLIEFWLDRKFDFDGNGSPFPRKLNDKDQRKVEIWMQVQGYVLENVEI